MPTSTSRGSRPSRRPYSGGGRTNDRSRSRYHSSDRRSSSRGGAGRGRGGGGRKQPSFDPSQFINTNPVEVSPEVYTPKHRFADFALDRQLIDTLRKLGLDTPSPIQDQVIPHIIDGRDVIGLAETGTGKTAAFLLPLIERTYNKQATQTLILTPTRELALQVEAEFRKLAGGMHLYATTCVGGTNINPQIRALKRHQHFVIGTPGRVLDLMKRGHLKTNRFTGAVLDEADRMLDMGFINDIREILSKLPKQDRHTLFFSATMTKEANALVNEFMVDPIMVSVKKKDVTNSIAQDVVRYQPQHKFDTLLALLSKQDFTRVIIFGSMKHSVEKLANQLTQSGIPAESIHGNKSHGQRQRSLTRFKGGHVRIMVATDVAARGIHVDDVSHVINYDLPNTFEDYVHRIGRTGRGSKRGQALTFVPQN